MPVPPPRSADFLARACAEARQRVARDRAERDLDALVADAGHLGGVPSLSASLTGDGLGVIAEVKRASPSRGHIADVPDPAGLAGAYLAGGVSAVSVLTEPIHFRGSLDDLRAVAGRIHDDRAQVPVLRKDFTVDAYQVWQARVAGAAAVLLIVAALDDDALAALLAETWRAGMEALVETHSSEEVARAAAAHADSGVPTRLVLGVNARDLTTLDVDLAVVERVARTRPADAVLVAESGVHGPADAARMRAAGADAVLVGEHVATAPDPAAAVAALRLAGDRPLPTEALHLEAVHAQATDPRRAEPR